MTTPNVLVIAKTKDDETSKDSILQMFKDQPRVILEKKGKIEIDVLKEFSVRIRLRVFEAGDHSLFRKRHNAVKTITVMTDNLLDALWNEQDNLLIANYVEKVEAHNISESDFNRAMLKALEDIRNNVASLGGIAVFVININSAYYCFFSGASMKLSEGTLFDVIPTVLDMLGFSKPDEMKGTSIII